ncbi:MAG: hypothetical protein PHV59_08700 [Victivallales bacterium]|nr:hypothetical protein [Victivallales bacterium]
MDIQILLRFFLWCTVIDGVLLVLGCGMGMFFQDFVYRIHHKWFNISREHFSLTVYVVIGMFKVFFLFFNLVPCLALWFIS